MTFLKSPLWLISFPRTTYVSFSVLFLQIANRKYPRYPFVQGKYLSSFFHQGQRNPHKTLLSFFLIHLRWNLFLSSDNHCDRNCIWLNLSCALKYPGIIRMFLINFNLVKFLFEDLWVKRKLTRDVPVTWTTWNIFNIHKILQ